MSNVRILSPDDPRLDELCAKLAEGARELDATGNWPEKQLRLCGEYGVFEWFIGKRFGGQQWSDVDVVRGYLKLSEACLATTFIITQRTGACRRIEASENELLKADLLPSLTEGETFATVGISHLTTSRRHMAKPVLSARVRDGGYLLDGFSPWVTGAPHADTVVVGATVVDDDGPTERQLLAAVPTDLEGVTTPDAAQLVGLTSSKTGPVEFESTLVPADILVAGPVKNVMQHGSGASTGGHETSTLAVGLTAAALRFLQDEANRRDDLREPADTLAAEHAKVHADLLAIASSESSCTKEELRQRANSLVLRATQAALAAAKGSGYVIGHPAGRWCKEALFFLVWSCPQPVMHANLCELARA